MSKMDPLALEMRKLTTHNESLARENERLKLEDQHLREEMGQLIHEQRSLRLSLFELNKTNKRVKTHCNTLQEQVKALKSENARNVREKDMLKGALRELLTLNIHNFTMSNVRTICNTVLQSLMDDECR